jgi:hypothetical protein
MNLVEVSEFSRDQLFTRLRRVQLRGFEGAHPYAQAQLELIHGLDPNRAVPAQNYVLREGVQFILELRSHLKGWNIDPFALEGGVTFLASEDPLPRTLIPPIIEESIEDGQRTVWLVADGMHRMYAARSLGLPISVVLVKGASFPYYAFPIADGWEGVQELEQLPTVHQKKIYRLPTNYKALFRDFNSPFPNVQTRRARSNPTFLQSGD